MIRFEHVHKDYRQHHAIIDITFEIGMGELVVLIGPSGCGKTTTLKMINRLIHPTSGRVFIDGEDIAGMDAIALRRTIGYVIQSTGLFPHMTVRENIELVPRLLGKEESEVTLGSVKLMEMIGLAPDIYLDRYPAQLSGGQKQRVGVARAFACDPEIILMDEPFSSVDPIARSQLQDELAELQSRLRKTIVFVTHDIEEAIKLADRVCIMNGGKIVQYDRPEEVMKNPATDFVGEFLGKYRIWSVPELIRARDIMIADPVSCRSDATILHCMERMRARNVGRVFLVEKGKPVGIVAAKDVRGSQDRNARAMDIAERDFHTVGLDDSILDILELVGEDKLSVVPVVGPRGALAGIITQESLVTTLSRQFMASGKEAVNAGTA